MTFYQGLRIKTRPQLKKNGKPKRKHYIDEIKQALLNYKDHPPEETILVDAESRAYCSSTDCDQIAQVENYCRYHYLSL